MIVSSDFDPFDESAYEPTEDEIALMRGSSEEERAAVQAMILSACSCDYVKVARIVADILNKFAQTYPHLPIAFIQANMQKLEDIGKVQIVGDLWAMRFSEIRLTREKSLVLVRST